MHLCDFTLIIPKEPSPRTKSSLHIQVHEMGPNMDVVLITSLENIATFININWLFSQLVYTSFTFNGNSMLQISHETKANIHKIVRI